jgi:hypothetical protein
MDTKRIAEAADRVIEMKELLVQALLKEHRARFNLEAVELVALANGQVTGKNETERKANLYTQTQELHDDLAKAERSVMLWRTDHEIALLRWEQIKLELRAEELVTGGHDEQR